LAHFKYLILPFLLVTLFFAKEADAQTSGYELLPAPDVWYNDVDGIRIGILLKGQVPGTFEDGPHRLDAGIWLGTWLPKTPVSYYISFTEPISAWSDFGSEASVEFISSIRTGYHNHGIGFNKRWQQGFDERRYREFGIYNSFEKRFDKEYTPFELLWSDQSKLLTSMMFEVQDDNSLGWYNLTLGTNFQYLDDFFTVATLTATQRIELNDYWGFRFRIFSGIASDHTSPEYLFSRSMRPAIHWMRNGFTRAKGTIPQPWMQSGKFQVAGGANLRGYISDDIESFKPCDADANENCLNNPNLFNSIAALNAEFDFWNPVSVLLNDVPYASDFLRFRSYLFFDSGKSLGIGGDDPNTLYSNAGTGISLSLNIPDYRGKPRGFVLRYEIPFWLSEPGDEKAFKFRHVFGFGAVISF